MIIFCSSCGYRDYTQSQAISQELCPNCFEQGSMKELRLNDRAIERELRLMK